MSVDLDVLRENAEIFGALSPDCAAGTSACASRR